MRVVICGVGALGSAVAVACRNLDVSLRLVDFDRVESKNLLSQAFVKQSVGKNKAQALKMQLQNFYGVKVEAKGVRLAAGNVSELLGGAGLVLDCFDNAASRQLICEYVRESDIPCLHGALSADGTYGMVRWDEAFAPDAEDAAGQATCENGDHLPFISMVSAVLARTASEFVQDGSRLNAMVSLSGVQRS
ncbi:MAG: HesA/MoeB/ThiF family protein [Nannocystales bacterium]